MATTATTNRKRLTTNVVVISTVAIWLLTVYTHTDILTQAGMCVCVWVHTGTKALTRRPTKILTGALCRVLSSRKGAAATASLDYAMRSLFHSYTHTRTHSRHTHTRTHTVAALRFVSFPRSRKTKQKQKQKFANSKVVFSCDPIGNLTYQKVKGKGRECVRVRAREQENEWQLLRGLLLCSLHSGVNWRHFILFSNQGIFCI